MLQKIFIFLGQGKTRECSHKEDQNIRQEVLRRSSMFDRRNPELQCPGGHHRDYNLVGPPGKWTKCYHFNAINGRKDFDDAQKFCRGIKGIQSITTLFCIMPYMGM